MGRFPAMVARKLGPNSSIRYYLRCPFLDRLNVCWHNREAYRPVFYLLNTGFSAMINGLRPGDLFKNICDLFTAVTGRRCTLGTWGFAWAVLFLRAYVMVFRSTRLYYTFSWLLLRLR